MLKRIAVFVVIIAASMMLACDSPVSVVGLFDDYTIGGTIVSQQGRGIPNVEVVSSKGEVTYTDPSGAWSMQLRSATTVSVTKAGWSFAPSKRNITRSSTGESVRFVGQEVTFGVTGQVVDANGVGIPNVTVRLGEQFADRVTDANGEWSTDGLYGVVNLTPTKTGWSFSPETKRITYIDDRTRVEFVGGEPDRGYALSGRVVNVITGEGLANATIRLRSSAGVETSVRTGSRGYWNKSGFVGETVIAPEKEGWTFEPANVYVTDGDSAIDFEGAYLVESYSAGGFVLRDFDDPLSGIPGVRVLLDNGDMVVTGSDGSWHVAGLTGQVNMRVELDGWSFRPSSISTSAGDPQRADLFFEGNPQRMYEAYETSGVVIDQNGDGVPAVVLHFSAEDGTDLGSAITKKRGTWVKSRLWGTVIVTPQYVPDPTRQFHPPSQTVTGPDTTVDFLLH